MCSIRLYACDFDAKAEQKGIGIYLSSNTCATVLPCLEYSCGLFFAIEMLVIYFVHFQHNTSL